MNDPWTLGGLRIANRVVLAPLAGIGNWFVRLQARRHGAALAVSEMVSSHAVHYRNERTLRELLRIHPDEHPVAIQLFGSDPEIMRSAAAQVAAAGADIVDLNMGCPVPKVIKTGAGAALISDHDRAVAVARAAVEGSDLPVTVKLRSGRQPGERDGVVLAQRLVAEAGVAGIAFHPRSAAVHHKGHPDYELAAELVDSLEVPVIVSGGLGEAEHVRWVFRHTGCAAVMLARGALGNPWLFARVLDPGAPEPSADAVLDELDWVIARAAEHLGEQRAARYLRQHYPWYLSHLSADAELRESLQRSESLAAARELLAQLRPTGASRVAPVASAA